MLIVLTDMYLHVLVFNVTRQSTLVQITTVLQEPSPASCTVNLYSNIYHQIEIRIIKDDLTSFHSLSVPLKPCVRNRLVVTRLRKTFNTLGIGAYTVLAEGSDVCAYIRSVLFVYMNCLK